jgi:hypothetical protein
VRGHFSRLSLLLLLLLLLLLVLLLVLLLLVLLLLLLLRRRRLRCLLQAGFLTLPVPPGRAQAAPRVRRAVGGVPSPPRDPPTPPSY